MSSNKPRAFLETALPIVLALLRCYFQLFFLGGPFFLELVSICSSTSSLCFFSSLSSTGPISSSPSGNLKADWVVTKGFSSLGGC
jgi:hypothetical protein